MNHKLTQEEILHIFIHHKTNHYEKANRMEVLDEEGKYFTLFVEMLEEEYRKYLGGLTGNLRQVNVSVRELMKNSNYDPSIVKGILNWIETLLYELEIYELMSKHFKAKSKVLNLLNKGPSGRISSHT